MASTFFGIGYAPIAPGSVASFAAGGLAILLMEHLFLYIFVFVGITAIGFWSAGKMERLIEEKDPSCVVIDEASGIMIAFFMLPRTPEVLILAFFLFRAFDMFKIYPVSYFERKPGATGIMMDDIVAGVYANVIMRIALYVLKFA